MNVSKEVARFFASQVAGSTEGQMAFVANNPTLRGLCQAFDIAQGQAGYDDKKLSEFLRQVADRLEESE